MHHRPILLLLLLLPFISACRSLGREAPDARLLQTDTGSEISLEALVADLSRVDAVFFGEEHDNDVGHRLQFELVQALLAQDVDLILSLEQFEADVQGQLDLYVAGAISQEKLLATSRPWGNYLAHYSPIIELAKTHRIPVIAANIPRPIARRVAYEGLETVDEESIAPPIVWTAEPEYAELFARAMGRTKMDYEDEGLTRWFAAQCIKDEKMAESISRALLRAWAKGEKPLLLHLNGKFHSNYRLGTVSRLLRRHPRLDLRVIGMQSAKDRARSLTDKESRQGEYMYLVKPQPEKTAP